MREFWQHLFQLFPRALRGFPAVIGIFYHDGRQALLDRTKARTDLAVLAVEKERMEIDLLRANGTIDLALKIEKIKDPELRENARAALSFNDRSLPTVDDSTA